MNTPAVILGILGLSVVVGFGLAAGAALHGMLIELCEFVGLWIGEMLEERRQ